MENVINTQELKSLADEDRIIANYCNAVDINISNEMIDESFNSFLVSLCGLIKSKGNNIEYYMANIVTNGDKKYIRIKYKIGKNEQKLNMPVHQVGYDKFISNLIEIINISVLGSESVNHINKFISNVQSNSNSQISIDYRVGILDQYSEVLDWDYDHIEVRLNRKSSLKLIDLYNSNNIDDIISKTDWSLTICKFIEEFNSLAINEALDASMNNDDLTDVLTKNMINTNDIKAIISKIKNNRIDNIKTVSIINELGKFIVICNWSYTGSKVELEIMHNKVLDIENNRFVSNRDIVDRLRDKIARQCGV